MGFDFHIDYLQLLSPAGVLSDGEEPIAQDSERLVGFHRAMTRARSFDTKAIALQRTGQLGTFASALGQEAIGVGVAAAMRRDDLLVPSYRDHAAQFMRGVSMKEILLYWGGDERGSDFANARTDFPICVPVGTQVAHAVGGAYAFKLRKEERVAVCFIGDGGTGNGGFYEPLNMAGVWRAPLVVIINNNGWAISTPRALGSAAETLAQKAVAAGVTGRQVDGNDVLAVHQAAREAIEKARGGDGPTVIEALSYRLGDHTTADDATRYRDPETVRAAWAREPIGRLRTLLMARGLWSPEQESALLKACGEEVEREVASYLATPALSSDSMFDNLFATLPSSMRRQRDEARRHAPAPGGRHG
ncbi:pyruvate dehydrogenase (acetyl-transferring) E1 component subunit alpha [Methylocystis bryophila]|uniref:Pyruvate dehydrogenase E1 component subunit alpha n=1 Tax=Methylocystis bryophila TaxID=655015 RepID=A0A1W6MXT4_9HYPH|nr:pyruvate dehydrogenase (acetyl-transferring) E1 component subunit alpha [Methylocystis bryophila]ARN82405.1 pyruvate dehydrogenase (acetyl-transferring) E1 component subunit alpha [Methylocystis bryophila]BDV38580.1 pyruvate dehydrogenase E1 component subunit alpha [Methylocystis bryophila]